MLNLYNSTGQLDYTPDSSSDRIIIVDREDDVQTNSESSFFDPSLPVSPAFSEFSFIAQHHNDDVAKKERANSVPILPIAFYALSDVDNRLRTARAQSDPLVKGQRSLPRKLPPKLTESLELLTLTPAPQSSSAASSPDKLPKPLYHLGIDMPEVPSVPITTSSFVPPPRPSKSIKRKTSNPSTIVPTTAIPLARRIVPSPSPPSPSFRTSTSESTYLATPTSSVHRSRASDESGSSPVACSSGSASACGTWSAIDEEDYKPKMRESRKEKRERKRAEKAAFDVDTPPSMRALYEASMMDVIGEDGQRVKFGDLVRRGTTIVIFIRHCKFQNPVVKWLLTGKGFVHSAHSICNQSSARSRKKRLTQPMSNLSLLETAHPRCFQLIRVSWRLGTPRRSTKQRRQSHEVSFQDVYRSHTLSLPSSRPYSTDR